MPDPSRTGTASTSQTLEEAAVRLLRRDGVLKGLNLREVADEAGVNRALVYHHFGSRRELLRSALRSGARKRLGAVASSYGIDIADRFGRFLDLMIRQSAAVKMTTLLLLDGDEDLRVMPLREQTVAALERDRAEGIIDTDDVEALHIALICLVYGYIAYRSAVARELGVDKRILDSRMRAMLESLIRGLAVRPSDAAGKPRRKTV